MNRKTNLPPLVTTGTKYAATVITKIEFPTPAVKLSRNNTFFDTQSPKQISPLQRRLRKIESQRDLLIKYGDCVNCGKENPKHWGANPCGHTTCCLACLQQLIHCPTCGKQIKTRFRNIRNKQLGPLG